MRGDILLASATIVLGAIGTWMMLPHRLGAARPRQVHAAGAALVGLALLAMLSFLTPPGPLLTGLFFYGFALGALACGVLMITSRNPVYSALWFAAVVLSTSGLFLLAGAQFLAAGTVIVYAGAIIVTFLFVIMLAQAEGQALYDRSARSPARATISCYLLLWTLLYALLMVQRPPGARLDRDEAAGRLVRAGEIGRHYAIDRTREVGTVLDRAIRETARLPRPVPPPVAVEAGERGTVPVPPPHVAGLGGTLFADHLITVEVVGALLFVALVGAAAIATPKPPVRPGPATR